MDFEDDPLQTALATAFTDSPIPQRRTVSLEVSPPSASLAIEETQAVPSEAAAEETDEFWKSDYDKLLAGWRAESSVARDKAERERERWRLIREQEEAQEKAMQGGSGFDSSNETEWERVQRARRAYESNVTPTQGGRSTSGQRLSSAKEAAAGVHGGLQRHESPSPNDVRDLVAGETPRGHDESPETLLPRPEPPASEYTEANLTQGDLFPSMTAPSSNPESRTWEEVPSLDSSFPSLSFPDRSAAPSPEPRERERGQPPPLPSVTLAIFDSSLSRRTRVLALVSSLAINLFLPFVNGVMLGFGEIFAKNLVSAFGWKLPGMGIGIGAGLGREQQYHN